MSSGQTTDPNPCGTSTTEGRVAPCAAYLPIVLDERTCAVQAENRKPKDHAVKLVYMFAWIWKHAAEECCCRSMRPYKYTDLSGTYPQIYHVSQQNIACESLASDENKTEQEASDGNNTKQEAGGSDFPVQGCSPFIKQIMRADTDSMASMLRSNKTAAWNVPGCAGAQSHWRRVLSLPEPGCYCWLACSHTCTI